MRLLAGHEGMWDGWSQVAIWGTIMSAIIVVAIIVGVVFIVRAVAGRKMAGAKKCAECGVMVTPGNTACPTCKAKMTW